MKYSLNLPVVQLVETEHNARSQVGDEGLVTVHRPIDRFDQLKID